MSRVAFIAALMVATVICSDARAQLADLPPSAAAIDARAAEASHVSASGKKPEAAVIAREVLAARQKLLGNNNPELKTTLRWCYDFHREAEEWDEARACLAEIVELYTRNYGAEHWVVKNQQVVLDDYDRERRLTPEQYAEVRAARQEVFRAHAVAVAGDVQDGLRIAEKSVEVFERTIGTKYHSHIVALSNLAAFHAELGDLASSMKYQQLALAGAAELFGKQNPEYSAPLGNLAMLYAKLRDFPRALELAREDVELRRMLWGDHQPIYAAAVTRLGNICIDAQQYDEAIACLNEAMAIQLRAKGENDTEYLSMLHSLATVYSAQRDFARAKEINERVLGASEQTIGKTHFKYLSTLNNLALANQNLGHRQQAIKQLRQVVATCDEVYQPDQPERVSALRNLGALYLQDGDYDAAEPVIAESLTLLRDGLDRSFGILSERQQLQLANYQQLTLHMLLTVAAEKPIDVGAIYGHVLAWKGSVYLQQRHARVASSSPAARELLSELQGISRAIANHNGASKEVRQRPEWKQQINQLLASQEQTEAALARESTSFAQLKNASQVTANGLRQRLPPEAVLIDFVEYHHHPKLQGDAAVARWRTERRLVAFVLKRDAEIELVQIGPVAPLAVELQKWQREIMQRRGGVVASANDLLPQYALERTLWRPLAPHAKDCKTIILSPDGIVSSFPWAAIPTEDGRYLIEQFNLVTMPLPRQMGSLQRTDMDAVSEPSLCLVGGIDFGASPGVARETSATTTRAVTGSDARFTPLPGTAKEVEGIAKFFRTQFPKAALAQGKGANATEDRVRTAASRFNHLHFATHGFFAQAETASPDSSSPSAAENVHPGLLSGIALTGANRGSEDGRTDDGILTALEVASLDLNHVELVVLSACETGLGTVVRGEGVLGLQRAFQLAGARASVASLWQVDDAATQTLMIEFYRNLWSKPTSNSAALRQAQLAMLERYDPKASELRARGLVLLGKTPAERLAVKLPPYYWAAFVVSEQTQ